MARNPFKVKRIAMIGLGAHAQRIYYPLLEKKAEEQELELVCVIDIRSMEAKIRELLKTKRLQPETLLFVDDSLRYTESIAPDILAFLNQLVHDKRLDGVIIACSPESHFIYLDWAIDSNLAVLVDKPILAPSNVANDPLQAQKIYSDYMELKNRLSNSKAKVYVQVQRRAHTGYRKLYAYLTEFIREFQVPISFIQINHADGMWVMPDEWEREHHPYKYGAGKLFHSGYHFVDLLAWFLDCNLNVSELKPDQMDFFVQSINPYDFQRQFSAEHYRKLLHKEYQPSELSDEAILKTYGEMDVFVQGQVKEKDWVISNFSLNLQQNSFSTRGQSIPPIDPYKGNGRVRHEHVDIKISTLLNIQVHSYQSHGINDEQKDSYGPGHQDHFDIQFYRNSKVVGGVPFEEFKLGKDLRDDEYSNPYFLGHNEFAREVVLSQFLTGEESNANFYGQELTNYFLTHIYQGIADGRAGRIPHHFFRWLDGR